MTGRNLLVAVAVIALASGCGDNNTATSGGGGQGGMGQGGSGGQGAGGPSEPDPQYLPAATGSCPDFVGGDVTFAPAGIAPRDVRIWVGDNPTAQDGPLVFYWHGTGSNPGEVAFGLSNDVVDQITAAGGVVAAPYHDPAAGTFPWFLTAGGGPEDDLILADEILACAIEKVGIDLRRIHVSGMSAGGLQTTQHSYRRSGYIASVAPYSGGRIGTPPQQEEQNKFAAMIFHGGPQDVVVVNFQTLSESYRDDLRSKGHFAFICNHNMQHTIPQDAQPSVWQFFQDHPFGTQPSPYEGALPAGFPSYCNLQ